jgi:hypothetical protein
VSLSSTHYESEYAKVDALIWISRSSGLTPGEELDMDAGDLGKSHTSARNAYSAVVAPVGANRLKSIDPSRLDQYDALCLTGT